MRGYHFDGKIMFDMMTDKKQLHVSSKCYFRRIFGNEFNFQIHFDYITLPLYVICLYVYTWYEREKCIVGIARKYSLHCQRLNRNNVLWLQ